MMISTKGRYALRVMIDIAEHQHDGYIPLKEIAARQEISEKYLEAIVKSLVKERYLTGLRGKSGGYRLTKAPEEYTVGSILRLSEGSLAPVACLEQNPVECRRIADVAQAEYDDQRLFRRHHSGGPGEHQPAGE